MEPIHPVIIGGGIIGLSTAYYLLTHSALAAGSTVTLVERTAIAHGASGRAMGMIGREWQPKHTLPLSRLSWKCYEELHETLGGDEWEWIVTPALGVEVHSGVKLSRYRSLKRGGHSEDSDGFNGEMYQISDDGAVAHVNPGKFCQALCRKCLNLGLRIIIGTPTYLDKRKRLLTVEVSNSSGIEKDVREIAYSHLQISAGPWSAPTCRKLGLPVPAISNLPGHSIHIRPATNWNPGLVGRSIFAGIGEEHSAEGVVEEIAFEGGDEDDGPPGATSSIELITKPNGTVYIAGENGAPSSKVAGRTEPNALPEDPGDVARSVNPKLVNKLVRAAAILSDRLDIKQGAELVASQLCYRPTSPDGTPQLGWLDQEDNIFLAAGHGPWGITLGPGSGHLMADLIIGQDPGVPISPFRPSRFRLK